MRRLCRYGILLVACWAVTCGAAQRPIAAVRTERPPTIDGKIGADEWAGAARFENFVQFEPHKGKPATQRTVGYVLYDDTNIYVAVYAYDDQPEKIIARHAQRDGQVRLPQAPRDPVALPDDAVAGETEELEHRDASASRRTRSRYNPRPCTALRAWL